MEVTYRIYFGTEAVGCNFNDLAASACKCLPLSGDELLGGCGWHADPTDPSSAVWACTTITCQVAPLFGTQPLKMFFQDKACRDNCSVFPMGADDRVSPRGRPAAPHAPQPRASRSARLARAGRAAGLAD